MYYQGGKKKRKIKNNVVMHVNSNSTDRSEEVTWRGHRVTPLGRCNAGCHIKKAELTGLSHNFTIYQKDKVKRVNADMCHSHPDKVSHLDAQDIQLPWKQIPCFFSGEKAGTATAHKILVLTILWKHRKDLSSWVLNAEVQPSWPSEAGQAAGHVRSAGAAWHRPIYQQEAEAGSRPHKLPAAGHQA